MVHFVELLAKLGVTQADLDEVYARAPTMPPAILRREIRALLRRRPAPPLVDDSQRLNARVALQRGPLRQNNCRAASQIVADGLKVPLRRAVAIYRNIPKELKGKGGRPKNPNPTRQSRTLRFCVSD